MGDLFTLENLFTLLMLTLLQAVLGFDNLLYISIESKRVAEHQQTMVRRWGIGLAIGLRIVLLFAVIVFHVVMTLRVSLAAQRGQAARYPVNIRLIKAPQD